MAADSADGEYQCENCDESFEHHGELDEHTQEAHGVTREEAVEKGGDGAEDGEHEDAAATDTDAAGSTGSITGETNDAPSAAEPAEAAGPSGSDEDVRPDTDDDRDGDDSDENDS